MNKNILESKAMRQLRKRAEAVMEGQPLDSAELKNLSTEQISRLFHELDVHRVELEMQNEELRRTQDELEEALDKYTDLFDYAPIGYLIVQSYGIITSANVTAGNILKESRHDLVGTPIQNYIARDYQDLFYTLRRSCEKKAGIQSCEILLLRKGDSAFNSRLDCIAIPGDDGSTAFRISFSDASSPKRSDTKR